MPLYMPAKAIELKFEHLPSLNGTLDYKKKLFFHDNFVDRQPDEGIAEVNALDRKLPVKLTFTIVIFCEEGGMNISYNMQQKALSDGQVVILVPGTVVERLFIMPGTKFVILAVADDAFVPGSRLYNSTFIQKNFTSPLLLTLDKALSHNCISIYKHLRESIVTKGDTLPEELVKGFFMVMSGMVVINIQHCLMARDKEKISSSEAILKAFLQRVEEEHREHKDVKYYANKASLTPKYFAKVILKASGRHPLDLIREYVINDARTMLKSGNYNVDQICNILHFSSRSQFNKYFKDATGISPVRYAKS